LTINAEENLDRRSDDEIEGDCLGTLPKTEAEDSDQERTKPLLFRSSFVKTVKHPIYKVFVNLYFVT